MGIEKRKAILELFESSVSGVFDESSLQRLRELLDGDVEAQAFYVDQCQIHTMLAWEHGTLSARPFPQRELASQASQAPRDVMESLRVWRWLAVCASILFLVSTSLAIYIGSTGSPPYFAVSTETELSPPNEPATAIDAARVTPWKTRAVVAELTRNLGADLTASDGEIRFAVDHELRQGRYLLSSGLIEVTFPNDVQLVVESPADFEILSTMRMVIHDGRMSAKVSEQGRGFEVETPSGNLVDYGTEFSVDVMPGNRAEYHVFQGEVKIRPKNPLPDSKDLTLITGQAAAIQAESGIPQGIDIDHDRFVRRLDYPADVNSRHAQLVESLQPTTWLRMCPSSDGERLEDVGANSTDATIVAGESNASFFKPGTSGAALYLNGPATRSYAKIEDYQPAAKGTITFCAWVLADSRPRWATIAKHWSIELTDDKKGHYGLGGQFHFGLKEDAGDLELQIIDGSNKRIQLREGDEFSFPIGQWQHVAFVVDDRRVRLYRNGKEICSAICNGLATNGPVSLGIGAKLGPDCNSPDPTNPGYWHGRIDELIIFDKPLKAGQINRLYKSAAPHRQL